MMPARPPENNSSDNSSDPSATTARSLTAFLIPPPMTVVVQFNGGLQLEFTPSPERLVSPLIGVPIVMGGIPMTFVGGAPSGMENDSMMRAMHELFIRSQSEQRGPPPTSKSFLDTLPSKIWDSDANRSEKYTDCAICLSEYETKDQVISLPCGHVFHKDCGMHWLVEHNVCPTCRYQLPTQEDANKPAAENSSDSASNNAEPEPERRPEQSQPDEEPEIEAILRTLLGVRRERSNTNTMTQPERVVRQRVDNSDSVLPGAVPSSTSEDNSNNDAELDNMLEEEARRFVEEEKCSIATQPQAADDGAAIFDDVDMEELLRDTRPATSSA
uniref:RING-type domain-containing protein n=1 Tax=Globisporangium ultimum (strain ATCC 200006 / CBS 805.95 / DAOM BR144) TaxID=431595 RepID=K3WHV7_GLOUD